MNSLDNLPYWISCAGIALLLLVIAFRAVRAKKLTIDISPTGGVRIEMQ